MRVDVRFDVGFWTLTVRLEMVGLVRLLKVRCGVLEHCFEASWPPASGLRRTECRDWGTSWKLAVGCGV